MADQNAKPVEHASDEAAAETVETKAAAAAPSASDGQELSDEQLAKVSGGRLPDPYKHVVQNMRG